ncbi:maltose ABC transporter substrate-binding protein [Treponema sp.]|uniref:sugar ABC transporter substrate-binding protein n=1 Tax=Treponema sp. TaxID=166 RepID=UPI00298E4D68|nr:maltose ABC transporter substrate-binding protein [Treponema sp.]MCQ2242054.1 maltose ABC transporter substrate-binding protein [Treponema sp.]
MKKVVFAVAAIAAGVLALTGCSKKEGASVKKSEEKVVLTVWESLQGPDEFIKQAGEAYAKTHPNVEIKYVNVELGDAAGQIALDGPAGVGPDIFAAPHDKLGELVNGGHVLPTVNADAVKKSVLGACSQALTYEGKMYGYPISAETYALFYNKDLIAESDVPKTWEDLAKWTKTFNANNSGKRGFVMDVGNGYYTIIFTTSAGNRLFGTSGTDTSSSYLNTASSVKGMKLFQSLKEALNVPAADLDTGNCDAAFQGGKAAMHITGPWNIKNFKDAGLNFGVAPLPSLPGDKTPAASFSGTRAMFVSAYSDHPAEAADFAQFLISASMQQLRFDLTGAMPSIDTPVSSPYIGGFLKQLDYAFPMPSIPEMGKFWETMGNTSKNIWDGADAQAELDACNAAIISK